MGNVREKLYWNSEKNFVVEVKDQSKYHVVVKVLFDLRRNSAKINSGLIQMERSDFDKLSFINFNDESNYEELLRIYNKALNLVRNNIEELGKEIYAVH